MNLRSILYILVLLAACLTSCEMQDELKGNKKPVTTDELGLLALDLSVKEGSNVIPTTKSLDISGFDVILYRDGSIYKQYTYEEFEAANPIELPVGVYSIEAATAGEIKNVSETPYYAGNEEIRIEKKLTSKTTVVCKIQNVKIALNLDADFAASFSDYSINVTDGSSVYTFEKDKFDYNLVPVYFKTQQGVKAISMSMKATSAKDSKTVSVVRNLVKPEDYDNGNFVAGDFLNVNVGAVEEEDPDQPDIPGDITTGTILKPVIHVDLTMTEREETIEIEVEEETVDPTPDPDPDPTPDPDPDPNPDDNAPVLSGDINKTIRISNDSYPSTVDIIVTSPGKIKNLMVTIGTNSDSFEETIAQMSLSHFDMANPTEEQQGFLTNVGLIQPSDVIAGATQYTFSIGGFMSMLALFSGTHTFDITVTDEAGKSSPAGRLTIVAE